MIRSNLRLGGGVGGKHIIPYYTTPSHLGPDVIAVLRRRSRSQKALALTEFSFEKHDCRLETRQLFRVFRHPLFITAIFSNASLSTLGSVSPPESCCRYE